MTDTKDKRQSRDFEDQQNELAGRDAGRMARFGVGTAREQELKDKKRSEQAFRNALDQLLLDPEYRRLYEELGDALGSAEIDADNAIASLQDQLNAIAQDVAAMEQDAARDPDGRSVFQYADGRVVYADGSEVPEDIAAGIVWPKDAPSAQDYFAAKDHQAALQRALEDWIIYRNEVLGGIRDRHDDPDNPMSKDEIAEALEEIERARPSLKLIETPAPSEAQPEPAPASELALPTTLR